MNIDNTEYVRHICEAAKKSSAELYRASTKQKNAALDAIAKALTANTSAILAANELDIRDADANGVPSVMIDRLRLTEERICGIANAVRELIALGDPIGSGEIWTRPNGLKIERVKVPLGVIAVIYEARPNVTADAAALCIKSGNACVLRGGREAMNTNGKIVSVMRDALVSRGFSPDCIGFIDTADRAATNALMNMRGLVDVLIPRGGKGLIRAVIENASVPVIETGAGNCHIYIDEYADTDKALRIAINAKASRPSVCNAVETMLVHRAVSERFLPLFAAEAEKYGIEIRGCAETLALIPNAVSATEDDWSTEYNDLILAVRVVGDIDDAVGHINRYTTGHSEAIVTENTGAARYFVSHIDCAAVYVNASTRFTDGGEFGFGAEIGISTQKLHARGPMGLEQLTTVKYIVNGDGQVR